MAKSILRDRHTAEDATQQAFLDIWRYIRRLREPSRFNGWSYRLLVHACYAAAKRATPKVGEVEPLSEDIVSTADAYATVADRDQLERAFKRLSLDYRTVIVLRHLIGMTPEEVADVLSVPRQTVYSRLRRAEASLQRRCRAPPGPPCTRPSAVRQARRAGCSRTPRDTCSSPTTCRSCGRS